MNRRSAIVALGGVVGVAAVGVATPLLRRQRFRRELAAQHLAPIDPRPLPASVSGTAAAFAGAMFGHRLSADEIESLRPNIDYLAHSQRGRRTDLEMLVAYADSRARHHGAASFSEASDDVRYRIIDEVMSEPPGSRRSSLLALVSDDERSRRLVRWFMIPPLVQLYTFSAPGWRRRGYTRWPGVPGDPREYTRAGSPRRC